MGVRHAASLNQANVATDDSVTINGTSGSDEFNGADGNDTLNGFDGNDVLCGAAGDDKIYAGDGNDMLNGGAGADIMTGGAGSDMYYVDNARDKIIEGTDPGQDTIHSTVTFTLSANVEYMVLDNVGGAINGTGNAMNIVITGNDSANTLNGGDGNDLLRGGLGNDTLLGGKGDDTLDGGADADKMTGGLGADTFVAKGGDTITDFSVAAGDALDIRDVLTGYTGGELDAFVHLTASGKNTVVSVDADGAANGANFVTVATLTGVSLSTLGDADAMAAHGALIA